MFWGLYYLLRLLWKQGFNLMTCMPLVFTAVALGYFIDSIIRRKKTATYVDRTTHNRFDHALWHIFSALSGLFVFVAIAAYQGGYGQHPCVV